MFLGSSRIRTHVIPPLFDQTLAEAGISHRSFNMGINALKLIELGAVADELIREGSGRLKHVFIEPVFSTQVRWRNVKTRRSIYFHDLIGTWQEIRCNIAGNTSPAGNAANALAFGYHYFNVGRLTRMPEQKIVNAHWKFSQESLEKDAGYSEATNFSPELQWWHDDFHKNRSRYRADLERDLTLAETPNFDLACQYELVLDVAARFREAGIEPVFLITPTYAPARPLREFTKYLKERGDTTVVLDYLDPSLELYAFEYWNDPRHIIDAGAEILTRWIARDASSFLNAQTSPFLAHGR